jgi:hypothetical protein
VTPFLSGKGIAGVREILGGVVPPHLIVGPRVGRPKIYPFTLRKVRFNAESDTYKSAGRKRGIPGHICGHCTSVFLSGISRERREAAC